MKRDTIEKYLIQYNIFSKKWRLCQAMKEGICMPFSWLDQPQQNVHIFSILYQSHIRNPFFVGHTFNHACVKGTSSSRICYFILLPEKFLQIDRSRAVVFQLNLKYLYVIITKLLRVRTYWIAMHCGCRLFKMAAKVEKFPRLYALYFDRHGSFRRKLSTIS